jgi:hypothetical protein
MSDMELKFPLALTAARIIRAGVIEDEAVALKLAHELHDIVATYRALYAARPECERDYPCADIEEADVIDTIVRTTLGNGPNDHGGWVYERFLGVDGEDLYVRYMKLADKVLGTDFAELC